MSDKIEDLEAELCAALCAKVTLKQRPSGDIVIRTPFAFPDGDRFSIYLKRLPSGGFRLSDKGATFMHLSYEHDISKLAEGTRNKVFQQILSEMGIADDEGDLNLEIPATNLATGIFQFGQALTKIHDLTFLNRIQVESTFYEDLSTHLSNIAGYDAITRDFIATGVPNADEYTADFCVAGGKKPVLIWGVPNQTKARLATIVMQHLQKHGFAFRSLVVYADMTIIPRADVSRLTTAANDQIPSLAEREALRTKLHDALQN
ncbi:protein of unknown function DUF1828 [Duganella sp. CF402]|uniref:DUF1828 domain-containing protein n=1 Tax=unclassified Duganella TaxID=2636909 RepID=UPI0008B744EA|nr:MULTISPECIES: DUF1828 domain-containing protein [unclassified Duganella]RZT10348.1 uncharacterized protein DUF1828 [Duganella sp. BK701]SEL17183.1 protein of unknown function DUF1828 [Duganella sp. CF402]